MTLKRKLASALSGTFAAVLVAGVAVFGTAPALAADPQLNPNPPIAGVPSTMSPVPVRWYFSADCASLGTQLDNDAHASYTPTSDQVGGCLVVLVAGTFFISNPIVAPGGATPTPPLDPGTGTPTVPPQMPLRPLPITPGVPVASAGSSCPGAFWGTNEESCGGLALPGGGDSVAPGGAFRARATAGPNEQITFTVTLPGAAVPGITVAGTASRSAVTNGDGNAFFNIRVPRNTPAGDGSVAAATMDGAEFYRANFRIAGRALHPAAG